MKFPSNCPQCGVSFEWDNHEMSNVNPAYMIQRGEPDFDKSTPDRVVDTIEECSGCHTLFRFRWKLDSIHKLTEVDI